MEDGDFEVYHVDFKDPTLNTYRFFLKTAHGKLSLHFASEPPALLTGTKVRVHGVKIDDKLALDGDSVSIDSTKAAQVPNTIGAQRTLVILVNFSGQHQPAIHRRRRAGRGVRNHEQFLPREFLPTDVAQWRCRGLVHHCYQFIALRYRDDCVTGPIRRGGRGSQSRFVHASGLCVSTERLRLVGTVERRWKSVPILDRW